jgi:hypothetical protein
MTPKGFERHRSQLLSEKGEIDLELSAIKNQLKMARREFAATGRAANRDWLSQQENRLLELQRTSQELQRQIGGLNAIKKSSEMGLDHFVHEVLLEKMSREEVTDIFREAIIRRRLYLDSNNGELS